jgi:hypothetical protein
MATRSAPRLRLSGERLFFAGMGVAILLLVFIGFAPSYYLRGSIDAGRPLAPLTPMILLHGAAFTAWVLLFIVQAGLISARQHRLHKRLGGAMIALAAAMVVLGVLTAVGQVGRGSGPPGVPPLVWLAVPLIDMPVFAGLVAAGYFNRRDPQTHKRFMLLATALMLQPAIGRLPMLAATPIGPEFNALVAWACSLALIAWDLASRGRVHRASAIGIAVLAAEQLFRLAVWRTEAWQSFAAWIVATLT